MIRKFLNYILSFRPESVMAGIVTSGILLLVFSTQLFKSFSLGPHDVMFMLLPFMVLLLRALLQSLMINEKNTEPATLSHLISSFLKPFLQIFHDWLPFILLSACYYSLYSNLILKVNPNCVDSQLAAIDNWLFGTQPAFVLEAYIFPLLTDFLSIIYFSYLIYFPGVALYFYLKQEYKPFRRMMMGYLILILMGVVSYIIFPAVGPEKYFSGKFTKDLRGETISHNLLYIMDFKVSHDCFPSMHVGLVLLVALYLREYRPRIFPFAILYVFIMFCSTIYLRYHYVIDIIAAVPFVFAAHRLTDVILKNWPGENQGA
ncbi:MAG: phosphatase PAP2 family protein [Candidatus Riflebacteria bacterium]|nr:phosphatase PAP2 family protein [Candidatus Riflebacteria bacterium]